MIKLSPSHNGTRDQPDADASTRQTVGMPDDTATSHRPPEPRAIRAVADRYVLALADLDPTLATSLGLRSGADRLPDLSPAGQDTEDALARATLAVDRTCKA